MYLHPEKKEEPQFLEIMGRFETLQYICQDCGRIILNNRSLETHMTKQHGSHVNTIPCHICGKLFKTELGLQKHLKLHEVNKQQILCGDCGMTFGTKSDMREHVERVHSDKKYICNDCGKELTGKTGWMRHIRTIHVRPREKNEICSQCQKTFYSLTNLRKHISDVHDKIKAFYCEVCPFKCARMDNLNLHRRKSHNKQNITKTMLISMVENDEHPFYTKNDLPMLKLAVPGY